MVDKEDKKLIMKRPDAIAESSVKASNGAIKNKLISQKSIDLLNYRIKEEEASARLYEDMHLFLADRGFTGAAALWKQYSVEEFTHAGWAKTYLLSLGIQPTLSMLPVPPHNFDGLPDIINKSYAHEVEVLNQCKELASNAHSESDFMLYALALKYVEEQTEELNKLQDWLDQLESFGSDKIALRLLDNAMHEYLEEA